MFVDLKKITETECQILSISNIVNIKYCQYPSESFELILQTHLSRSFRDIFDDNSFLRPIFKYIDV